MEGLSTRSRLAAFLVLGIIVGGVFATTYLAGQQQDIRQRAAEKKAVHQETAAPRVDITSPQNGGHVDDKTTVNVAILNDTQPEGIEVYLDDKQVTLLTTQPYTYTLSDITPGVHTLTVRAYDNQSRVGSKTIKVTR